MTPRSGWTSKSQQRQVGVIQSQLREVVKVGRVAPVPVANLSAVSDIMTRGAQVSFKVFALEGIDSFVLLRNFSRDPGSAQTIHIWSALPLVTTPQVYPVALHYADNDPAIAGKDAFYWIKVVPASSKTTGNTILSGPQQFNATKWPTAKQITGDVAVTQAYTPTTQPLTATTGSGANQATINIASFLIQYPFDTDNDGDADLVAYSSGAITPLLDSTTYFVYFDDPTYVGGAQTYIATVNNEVVTAGLHRQYIGAIATPAHGGGGTVGGGGGGGSGGPPCFTEDVRVITRNGLKQIGDILEGFDEVLTQRGWRVVLDVFVHDYRGPLCDMGEGYVTPDHRMLYRGQWRRAVTIFLALPTVQFTGEVFNLNVAGDGSDEEQCYTLANGWIAHNMRKV